ncbi:NADH:flavin oxidoreductase/NADH oxidase [Conidiobolus coronatus NRRL 28638]|uniref:NADH:flavin oxidoreductase/NADH oxidase n=1 Tax=Conidiobolus coronatus (strain ATCC 28846 / CBS 209.66 / NRRL 28638) TaxID=796925 RepID=A0A137PA72_CONC2|nr:NADH:flavin oxidoreductase/NADH oxidase [Conidiobolus coronatus NRRL 28638]|eukprot:KXN71821.1 NADH:flavin oxidoreductase/NADH oxidase [Conidiobolus coronatus NRRL 28638]
MTVIEEEFYHKFDTPLGQVILEKGQTVEDLPKLLRPITIKSVTLPNRVVVSPMCMFSSKNGFLTGFHQVHYGQFALNGAGLIIVEATAVTANGRISPNCAGIYLDEHVESHKRVVDIVHNLGGKIGIQIGHAGRKACMITPFLPNGRDTAPVEQGGWTDVFGPSDEIWDTKGYIKPSALTLNQIDDLIKAFVIGARRANNAGYDVLELHGAHGYLIHQFLSPNSNHRTDKYGGSFENRARFLLELVDEVNKVWPKEKPLFVRLSATDWVDSDNTWDIQSTIEISKLLKEKGVDLIDVSSGGNTPKQKINIEPHYQVPFAQKVREEVDILTGAVGLITNVKEANAVLEEGKADLILLAREFLKDPSFVKRAGIELNQNVQWAPQYPHPKPKV